jgi:hypothetical protein
MFRFPLNPLNPLVISSVLLTLSLTACEITVSPLTDTDLGGSGTSGDLDSPITDLDNIYQLPNDVLEAIDSGSIGDIDDSETLATSITSVLETSNENFEEATDQLFGDSDSENLLTAITWDPSHDSALLLSTPGANNDLLITNDSANGPDNAEAKTLAVIGETEKSRYIVMGGNPFRSATSVNEAMNAFMVNSIEWLTGTSAANINNIVIAHMDQSYYFPDYEGTQTWLEERLGSDVAINERGACDDSMLSACLFTGDTPDLLIMSQVLNEGTSTDQIITTVSRALSIGIPVLYLHHDGNLTDLGSALFEKLRVNYSKDNYWSKLRLTNASAATLVEQATFVQTQYLAFFNALENNDWSFTLANCDSDCSNQETYATEFSDSAYAIKQILNSLDSKGTYVFDHAGYEFEKLAILLADKYRQNVEYPMSLSTTPQNDFMRALYADYAQYQRRSAIPIPSDLGNFSRTVFPGVALQNKSIELVSRSSFKASGVYALPGEEVTVTRTDNEDTTVYVQVNSIRSGATHIWDNDGYNRPLFLTSQKLLLEPGETLKFTSTYGGPIHLYFNNNERNVRFNFENIGLHAFWNGPEDDVSFQSALDADLFDWAELITPAFEVHSKIEKMRESASNSNWPSGATLADATMTYLHNYPHVLAGFQGSGIDEVAEIHDFANANGWTIDLLDKVKHMNADQATCGYGCSGNPYDAYWSFNPVGHGDIHELGHGLERGRFRFVTKLGMTTDGHATTNPYSYYSKSRFYENTMQDPSCQNLPFDELYRHLQAAEASGDAFNYMADLGLVGWDTGVATYIQMMMAVENQGILNDGWHLWARLHMFDREFNRADNSEELWLSKRTSLGMNGLSLTDAKALNNNDWMILALSFISGHDFSDMFSLYGIAISTVASTQLDSLSYPTLDAKFYGANGSDFCTGLDKPALPLDGTTAWPY